MRRYLCIFMVIVMATTSAVPAMAGYPPEKESKVSKVLSNKEIAMICLAFPKNDNVRLGFANSLARAKLANNQHAVASLLEQLHQLIEQREKKAKSQGTGGNSPIVNGDVGLLGTPAGKFDNEDQNGALDSLNFTIVEQDTFESTPNIKAMQLYNQDKDHQRTFEATMAQIRASQENFNKRMDHEAQMWKAKFEADNHRANMQFAAAVVPSLIGGLFGVFMMNSMMKDRRDQRRHQEKLYRQAYPYGAGGYSGYSNPYYSSYGYDPINKRWVGPSQHYQYWKNNRSTYPYRNNSRDPYRRTYG